MKKSILLTLILFSNLSFAQKFDIGKEKANIRLTLPPLVQLPEKSTSKIIYPKKLRNFSDEKKVKQLFWWIGLKKFKEANGSPNPNLTLMIETEGMKDFQYSIIDTNTTPIGSPGTMLSQIIEVSLSYPVALKVNDSNNNSYTLPIINDNEKIKVHIMKNELQNYKVEGNMRATILPIEYFTSKENANYQYQENIALVSPLVEKKASEKISKIISNKINAIYNQTTFADNIKYFFVDEKVGFEVFNEGAKELGIALEIFNKNPDDIKLFKANAEKALGIFQKLLNEKSERNNKLKYIRALRENSYTCHVILRNYKEADNEKKVFQAENDSNKLDADWSMRWGFDAQYLKNELEKREELKKIAYSGK